LVLIAQLAVLNTIHALQVIFVLVLAPLTPNKHHALLVNTSHLTVKLHALYVQPDHSAQQAQFSLNSVIQVLITMWKVSILELNV
jgi:hypothetical protein